VANKDGELGGYICEAEGVAESLEGVSGEAAR